MDNETLIKLRSLHGYRRKPIDWYEVGDPIPTKLLEGLKQFKAHELGIEYNIAAAFSKTPEDDVFLVARRGSLYLVNTEGADYARYVRYVGTEVEHKRDIVELVVDEAHSQKIEITQLRKRFFWSFADYPEPNDREKDNFTVNGPYSNRQDAIDDASAYCQSA